MSIHKGAREKSICQLYEDVKHESSFREIIFGNTYIRRYVYVRTYVLIVT